jgi:hypothetical protein
VGSLFSDIRTAVRQSEAYAPVRRWRLERLTRRPGVYPDWRVLLSGHEKDWAAARESADGKRILIATSLGLHFTANTVDTLMAAALTLRGAKVDIGYCDGLPACQVIEHTLAPSLPRIAKEGPGPDFCGACTSAADRVSSPLGLNVRKFSDVLNDSDRAEAKAFGERWQGHRSTEHDDPRVMHAYAGALRFFGKGDLGGSDLETQIFSRYLAAAWLSDAAARRLIDAHKYDVIVAHHGIYVPQGQFAEAARDTDTRLVTWHPAYRRGRLIYQHGDTYHRAMIDEPESVWNQRALSAAETAELDAYLASRETGAQDWITFQRRDPESLQSTYAALDLDPAEDTYLLAANVVWDARLNYAQSAYGHMIEWAIDTVSWFAKHPDRQLVVRCHPGEVMNSPRASDRLDDALRAAFPEMPANVRLVSPENDINTYSIAQLSKGALIFNTKLGMELSARGMPVVVAGDAWIRGKGFGRDAYDRESYFRLLESPGTFDPLTESEIEAARRYVYHFYFRRCIPLKALDGSAGWPLTQLHADAYSLAKPGVDPNMDAICEGILAGAPFETIDDENALESAGEMP